MTTGIAAVESWIVEQEPGIDHVDMDMDLFEAGLVTSLQVVELLVVIERVGGVVPDRREVEPDSFRTLRAMQAKFFADAPQDAARATAK